jgi:hypothetical protein
MRGFAPQPKAKGTLTLALSLRERGQPSTLQWTEALRCPARTNRGSSPCKRRHHFARDQAQLLFELA